jgi:hypothetical protein
VIGWALIVVALLFLVLDVARGLLAGLSQLLLPVALGGLGASFLRESKARTPALVLAVLALVLAVLSLARRLAF